MKSNSLLLMKKFVQNSYFGKCSFTGRQFPFGLQHNVFEFEKESELHNTPNSVFLKNVPFTE